MYIGGKEGGAEGEDWERADRPRMGRKGLNSTRNLKVGHC